MNVKSLKLNSLPDELKQIAHPPEQLFWSGRPLGDIIQTPRVAVVGSRKATLYGKTITEEISKRLAQAGVSIISGLAFGIDSYAHRAAIEVGGCTVAVLPTPLDSIAPATHTSLAIQILKSGGALVSEYDTGSSIRKENFIARNRLVSALSEVLLVTEATKTSGSLHTARFALEQGKTVMAVPGNVNNPTSEGCNNLIKSGAIPVTSADDVFFALKISPPKQASKRIFKGTEAEQKIYDLVAAGTITQEKIMIASKLSGQEAMAALTSLELSGYIKPIGGGNWSLA